MGPVLSDPKNLLAPIELQLSFLVPSSLYEDGREGMLKKNENQAPHGYWQAENSSSMNSSREFHWWQELSRHCGHQQEGNTSLRGGWSVNDLSRSTACSEIQFPFPAGRCTSGSARGAPRRQTLLRRGSSEMSLQVFLHDRCHLG